MQRIRGETIKFASHIKKKEKLEECKLIEILKNLENASPPNIPKLEDTKSKLKAIRELTVKGSLIQSRVKNNLHYEKPTKYFCRLEKQRFIDKALRKLTLKDGSTITSQKDILKCI